jgi:hypothetical protein
MSSFHVALQLGEHNPETQAIPPFPDVVSGIAAAAAGATITIALFSCSP